MHGINPASSSGGPGFRPISSQPQSPLVKAFLNREGIQQILQAFSSSPELVTKTQIKPGANIESSLLQMQMVSLNKDQKTALQKLLGGELSDLVAVLATGEELAQVQKRFKTLKKSLLTRQLEPALYQSISEELNLPQNQDGLVFEDNDGGLYIIQAGLEGFKKSLDS